MRFAFLPSILRIEGFFMDKNKALVGIVTTTDLINYLIAQY
ncbi:hypothetical protein [Myroides odoratus]